MHIFVDNFRQGTKYSAQITIHQAEIRREDIFTRQISLSISSLLTEYLNLDSSPGCCKTMREQIFSRKHLFFVEVKNHAENVSEG